MMQGIKDNTVLVILGANGDLARKKLFPGLFSLERRNVLPSSLRVIGFAPDELCSQDLDAIITEKVVNDGPEVAKQLETFTSRCAYASGHEGGQASFEALRRKLDQMGDRTEEQHRSFYMALPPNTFESVSAGLRRFCYSARGDNLLIIEKPFGHDLESSRALQRALNEKWSESEIFRIDHYLGKEVVNNLLVIRFANQIFGGVWNRQHISAIEISMTETGGAEGRGSYFHSTGVIRDVMQNHMMHILALLAMERPKSFTVQDLCDEKTRVLSSMTPIAHQDTIVGQYIGSEDKSKPAFRDEDDVPNDSKCVTFCATRARIENERWNGIPILLKAGKALDRSETKVTLTFRPSCNAFMFKDTGPMNPNQMIIRIQPDEGIHLTINSLVPDLSWKTGSLHLDMSYKDIDIPEAYESLLLDVLKGDFTRSVRADEVDLNWKLFQPLLENLEQEGDQAGLAVAEYEYGSKGPGGLDQFVARQLED